MTRVLNIIGWLYLLLVKGQASVASANGDKEKVTDLQLIREYLSTQNEIYFRKLYRRYSTKVYSKCISLLKEEALAKDAMQEIFLKIFLNLSKFQEKSKFSTWVYSITYNYCIDFLRKRKKEQNLFSDEFENAPDLEEEVPDHYLQAMEVKKLAKVLENIPLGDKEILLMKYQEDMPIKEIAAILGKTDSAIKMKIKRAKHKAQLVYIELFEERMK